IPTDASLGRSEVGSGPRLRPRACARGNRAAPVVAVGCRWLRWAAVEVLAGGAEKGGWPLGHDDRRGRWAVGATPERLATRTTGQGSGRRTVEALRAGDPRAREPERATVRGTALPDQISARLLSTIPSRWAWTVIGRAATDRPSFRRDLARR